MGFPSWVSTRKKMLPLWCTREKREKRGEKKISITNWVSSKLLYQLVPSSSHFTETDLSEENQINKPYTPWTFLWVSETFPLCGEIAFHVTEFLCVRTFSIFPRNHNDSSSGSENEEKAKRHKQGHTECEHIFVLIKEKEEKFGREKSIERFIGEKLFLFPLIFIVVVLSIGAYKLSSILQHFDILPYALAPLHHIPIVWSRYWVIHFHFASISCVILYAGEDRMGRGREIINDDVSNGTLLCRGGGRWRNGQQ